MIKKWRVRQQDSVLNCTKKQFDWDNNELRNNEELVEDEAVSHPGITYDMPGIEL